MTTPTSSEHRKRVPLSAVLALLVPVLTLYAWFTNNVTVADGQYGSLVIQSLIFSTAALGLTLLSWPGVPRLARALLLLCAAVDACTLVDAGFRRLPALSSNSASLLTRAEGIDHTLG
jgi:hypothetical protein